MVKARFCGLQEAAGIQPCTSLVMGTRVMIVGPEVCDWLVNSCVEQFPVLNLTPPSEPKQGAVAMYVKEYNTPVTVVPPGMLTDRL